MTIAFLPFTRMLRIRKPSSPNGASGRWSAAISAFSRGVPKRIAPLAVTDRTAEGLRPSMPEIPRTSSSFANSSFGAGQRDGLRAIGCEIVLLDRLVAEPQIVAVFRLRREREEGGKRSQEKMFHPIPTAARAGAARKASAIAS